MQIAIDPETWSEVWSEEDISDMGAFSFACAMEAYPGDDDILSLDQSPS